MIIETIFKILAVLFCVTNLGAMGLELNLTATKRALKNYRVVILTFVWSWVIGPLLAVFITKILPISKAHTTGFLLLALTPTAPLLPILIRKAKADMNVSAAMMALAVVGTVVMMPLMAPYLIPGTTVSSYALGKRLVLTVLMPLIIGAVINFYHHEIASRLFPYVKKSATIVTFVCLIMVLGLYGKQIVHMLGQHGLSAMFLWALATGLLSYAFGFGMNQSQRSALSLGICSRNGAAAFVAFTTLPVQNPDVLVMVIMAGTLPAIIWFILAFFFASRAGKSAEAAVA